MRFALALLAAVVLATPALGQGIEGTWEVTAAENVPYEDDLVFGRMTVTADEIRSVFVFLDPDDGELIGRVQQAQYLVSDSQLVVREGESTTILDAAREDSVLIVRDVQTGVVFQMRAADPALALDPDLVGAWHGLFGKEETTLTFAPEGTVELAEADGDVDTDAYIVAGPYLIIDETPFLYSFARDEDGDRLILEGDGERRDFLHVSR